jgi:hypothetical protein
VGLTVRRSRDETRLAGRGLRRRRHVLPPADAVFIFFSNRLGCLGSLVVSLVATAILLLILGVIPTR